LLFLTLQRVQELFSARGASPQQLLESSEYALQVQEAGDLDFDISGAQTIISMLSKLVRPKSLQFYFSPLFHFYCIDCTSDNVPCYNKPYFNPPQSTSEEGTSFHRLTAGALLAQLVTSAGKKK
jgi:hypothetical protein